MWWFLGPLSGARPPEPPAPKPKPTWWAVYLAWWRNLWK